MKKYIAIFWYRNGNIKDIWDVYIYADNEEEAKTKFEDWLKNKADRVLQIGFKRKTLEIKEV